MSLETSGYLGNDENKIDMNGPSDGGRMNPVSPNPEKDLVTDILISDAMDSDFISLFKLQNSFNPTSFLTTVSGAREEEYVDLGEYDIHELEDLKCTNIPDELKDQFYGSSGISNHGTFPIICRSWVSIDNFFYIWQDETCSDLAMFPMNSLIHHAKVGPVKPGLFKHKDFSFILILVTTQDVVIIPLNFESSSRVQDIDYKQAMLQFGADVQLSVSLGGEKINDVIVTNEGRIFMISGTSLLEVEYRTKGWFGGHNAKLINHSKSFLSFLVPSIPFLSSKDEYVKITVDNSRGIIHILSSSGTIRVYSLANDNNKVTEIGEITNERIIYLAGRYCKVNDLLFQNIIAVVPIESSISQFIAFMVVTALGTRLYFGLQTNQPKFYLIDGKRDENEYNNIILAHIRLEPQNEKFIHSLPTSRCAYNAIVTKESTIVCYGYDNSCTKSFIVVYSNLQFPFQAPLVESFQIVQFKGVIWDLQELSRSRLSSQVNRSLPYIIPKTIVPTTCLTDENLLTYKYKIVTNSTISTFRQVSPLLTLQNFIQVEQFDSKKFEQFVNIHGRINILAMTLQIICSDVAKNSMVKTNAKKLFVMMHGEPLVVREERNRPTFVSRSGGGQPQNINQSLRGNVRGTQSNIQQEKSTSAEFFTSNVIYSTAHDAAYAFFSRVIGSLWVSELVTVEKKKFDEFYSTVDEYNASRIIRQLSTFLREIETAPSFMKNFKPLDILRDSTDIYSRQAIDPDSTREKNFAKQKERESMVNFVVMVRNTVEVLNLWNVFNKNNLTVVCNQLPVELRTILTKSTFNELIFEKDSIIKKMVRGLIRMHLKDNASVNTVSSELRKMCPSLFSQDDYKLLKAEELLKEATETVNIESKEYLVQEAIKILLSVSSQVDISKCVKFIVKLRFYKEAVQFCIRLGEKLDPGHLADMYIDQPKTALTNDRVEEAVQKIRQCYSSISYILLELNKEVNNKANALASEDVRHDIITTIIRTSSKAGLYKLYEDAIMRDDEFLMKYFQVDEFRDYLLWFIGQVDCPKHFEKLLDVQRSATNGHEYMAQLLYDKALDHKWTVDMDTRIFWLSQAIVFIQSGTKSTQQMKSMMAIKEALECAELQNFVARELELFCSDLPSRITDEFDHDELNCAKQVLHDLKRYIWPINDIITKVTNRFTIPLANLIIYKSIIGGNIQMEEICNHWDVILQDCFKYYKLKKETSEQTCSRIINLLKRIERAPAMNTAYLPKIHIVLRLIDFFILEKFSPSRVIDFCYNSIISLDGLVDAIGHTIKNEGYDNHEDIPVLRYLLQIIFELSEAFVSGQLHMASERKQKLGRKLLDIFATSQLAVQRLNITDFKYLSPITGSSNPFVFYSKEVKMTLNS